MDHHQLSVSSHGAHTQNFYQLSTISLFVYEIPLSQPHTNTPISEMLEATDERKSDQSN